MDILHCLAEKSKERVQRDKKKVPPAELRDIIASKSKIGFVFEQALRQPGVSFICEIKRASPSKGLIVQDFPYQEIAADYKAAGAAAISVLTEPEYFLGSDEILRELAGKISIPLLRKDFTVDEYQIYQARCLGAAAVLLICAILDDGQLREFLHIANSISMDALVEAHDEHEIERAFKAGARIIGVNNRNLHTFETDTQNCLRLRASVPDDVLFVAESGIKTREEIEKLAAGGVDAVLIGETLMRAEDRRAKLLELRGEVGSQSRDGK